MHIPDGYLSPSTCATLYVASAPFWYGALRSVRNVLSSRTIPALAVFSAFSFTVMMFNLPLPGGTTGHAVGMAIASIVAGPWTAILAVSIALLVQALLFGDGGITTFGANCFNMAVVGSLVSAGVYWLCSLRSQVGSRRRVFAAGLAGYLAINAAAFCAAVEFGLQPLLFRDHAGVPLYAPYPLSVAIPAMMIGHLTFAGLAELILSAGMVAYLQKADPAMLQGVLPHSGRSPGIRKLWPVLGLLIVSVPLGIIAGGKAWGEWHPSEFGTAQSRAEITHASGGIQPPSAAPAGLQRLSRLWKAPIADYSPLPFRSESAGYLLSAVAGVTAILLLVFLLKAIVRRVVRDESSRLRRKSFAERTIAHLLRVADESLFAEEIASQNGVLQRIDARAKVLGLLSLVLTVIAVHRWTVFLLISALICVFAVSSKVSLVSLAKRVWLPVLSFTGLVAAPALFLPGKEVLIRLPWNAAITMSGLQAAGFVTTRALCASSLLFLLLTTTRWHELLRALRSLRVPVTVIAILQICYRYIFVLLQAAHNMFEGRSVRTLVAESARKERRFVAGTAAALLDKAFALSTAVHEAMLARGFRGEAVLLNEVQITASSCLFFAGLLGLSVLLCWYGW